MKFKTPRRSKFARKDATNPRHRKLGRSTESPERRFVGATALKQARAFIAGIVALGASAADLEILNHLDSANPAYHEVVIRPR